MKKHFIYIAALLLILIAACERNPLYVDGVAGELVGTWIDMDYVDTLYTYHRASHIPDDYPGWSFKEDGTLMNRANAGFCGTPPISYADYTGEWSESDSIIDISVQFWGGTMLLKWKIMEITESELVFYQISSELLMEE